MAEEKKKEVSHISICRAENGFKICCSYESKEMSLGQRAGWVPCGPCESKDYVEKTREAVIKRLEEIL